MSSLGRAVIVAVVLALAGVPGCDTLHDVSSMVEGTDRDTFRFWAELQTIQYRENQEIIRLNQSNMAMLQNLEFDGAASGFSALAAKHAHCARQLTSLNSENVDSKAVEYRDRLIAAHEALQNEWTAKAGGVAKGDLTKLADRDVLKSCLAGYANLWKARYDVMKALKEKYDRDFDAYDR